MQTAVSYRPRRQGTGQCYPSRVAPLQQARAHGLGGWAAWKGPHSRTPARRVSTEFDAGQSHRAQARVPSARSGTFGQRGNGAWRRGAPLPRTRCTLHPPVPDSHRQARAVASGHTGRRSVAAACCACTTGPAIDSKGALWALSPLNRRDPANSRTTGTANKIPHLQPRHYTSFTRCSHLAACSVDAATDNRPARGRSTPVWPGHEMPNRCSPRSTPPPTPRRHPGLRVATHAILPRTWSSVHVAAIVPFAISTG
ncbi:hypothetical protein SSPNP10_24895 [Streptomyces sp. NP10]|nr:hypothetical protein SSPNP10_24895 [Streptomyces sp. NP10]